MKNICVLLSTYNGEKFLGEQLDSLLTQDLESVDYSLKIFVRDDGSKDKTCDILQEYCQKYPNIFSVVCGENLGFAKSFSYLIKNAPDADFYALCDQDDVWLPSKLKNGILALEKRGREFAPNLYATNTKVVNAQLKETHKDTKPFLKEDCSHFKESIILSNIAGCTMIFNNALRDLYRRIPSENIWAHDYTLGVLANCFGNMIYDENPQILYRQHGNNVFGSGKGIGKMWKSMKNCFKYQFNGVVYREACNLRYLFFDELPEDKKEFIFLLTDYKFNKKSKKKLRKYIKTHVKSKFHRSASLWPLFFGKL